MRRRVVTHVDSIKINSAAKQNTVTDTISTAEKIEGLSCKHGDNQVFSRSI
jgi:hypothetical protein